MRIVYGFLFCLCLVLAGFGQTTDKTEKIFTNLVLENEPIKLIGIKSNGKEFKFGEKAVQAEGWIKGLTITIKNVTDKPVTYVSIIMGLPETAETAPRVGAIVKLGVSKILKNKNEPLTLAPGATTEISFKAVDYNGVVDLLTKRNYNLANLTQADIALQAAEFEDGTRWSGNAYWRPDPGNPGKYINTGQHF